MVGQSSAKRLTFAYFLFELSKSLENWLFIHLTISNNNIVTHALTSLLFSLPPLVIGTPSINGK